MEAVEVANIQDESSISRLLRIARTVPHFTRQFPQKPERFRFAGEGVGVPLDLQT
jgi:hypothetical protein